MEAEDAAARIEDPLLKIALSLSVGTYTTSLACSCTSGSLRADEFLVDRRISTPDHFDVKVNCTGVRSMAVPFARENGRSTLKCRLPSINLWVLLSLLKYAVL
jgi:hypothetical protein